MRWKPAIYAKAFLAAIDGGAHAEEASKRLAKTLKRYGDRSLADGVLRAVERELVSRAGAQMVEVQFARPPKPAVLKTILGDFSKKDRVTTSIKLKLVAGTRIVINGDEELDLSLVGKLERMFML